MNKFISNIFLLLKEILDLIGKKETMSIIVNDTYDFFKMFN